MALLLDNEDTDISKREKIIYGFIRNYIDTNNDMNIPDSIKSLCAIFVSLYFDIEYEWNPNRGGYENDTIIEGKKLIFKESGPGHFRIVLSNQSISK